VNFITAAVIFAAMQEVTDILALAHRHPLMEQELELVHQQRKTIPGAVQYAVYRYRLQPQMNLEDVGLLAYNYLPGNRKTRSIELRFCISGNQYCNNPSCSNDICTGKSPCARINTFDVLVVHYPVSYLSQFVKGRTLQSVSDELLAFQHKTAFTTSVNLCSKTRGVLESLVQQNYVGALENIYVNSQLQSLLLYGLECLAEDKSEESFSCKFLANETDREKMIQAREILLQRIGDPITIKELSRKVGTNECYLKKGFKELFGTTVFEFYQGQRMEHAKYLLYEKGLSVTEVSVLLGYSSISHFSTAFKKHTGLKPCELLLR
jgi:AraC family transcriptional regulator